MILCINHGALWPGLPSKSGARPALLLLRSRALTPHPDVGGAALHIPDYPYCAIYSHPFWCLPATPHLLGISLLHTVARLLSKPPSAGASFSTPQNTFRQHGGRGSGAERGGSAGQQCEHPAGGVRQVPALQPPVRPVHHPQVSPLRVLDGGGHYDRQAVRAASLWNRQGCRSWRLGTGRLGGGRCQPALSAAGCGFSATMSALQCLCAWSRLALAQQPSPA